MSKHAIRVEDVARLAQDGSSDKEIAAELGCTAHHVFVVRDINGIESGRSVRLEANRHNTMMLAKEGMRNIDIANELKLNPSTVALYLTEAYRRGELG